MLPPAPPMTSLKVRLKKREKKKEEDIEIEERRRGVSQRKGGGSCADRHDGPAKMNH